MKYDAVKQVTINSGNDGDLTPIPALAKSASMPIQNDEYGETP